MIRIENFREVLKYLGFTSSDETIYTREYGNRTMKVDFNRKELLYPVYTNHDDNSPNGIIIHEHTTTNFSQNENFVVFECVCRLLEKGYRAEHIELEPRWTVGHGASGGRADILVRDQNRDSYIIIECKTAGNEYKKEKNNTEINGGQLFSYWQQITCTKWLALYASDWEDEKVVSYTSHVIHSEDDANILKLAEKDEDLLTYHRAHNNDERHKAWVETYNKTWLADAIFDDESVAYNVGVAPLRKRKLIDFGDSKKIVNNFEEILRHNNVSDKENAFNRLVALFICKLVDEIEKEDDSIVDFQYKSGTDTYESLQDRLQRLHHKGMRQFMREDVFYVPATYASDLFEKYTGRNRANAIQELNETIWKLKFYTNNDFAFKDVHNEELFFQNGKILVEVVQLFQPYRIVFSERNQVLGDLFEGLLNKGFKQNEGQFFTPMPITRFIWEALPLKFCIEKNNGIPKVIDYACGAGHFLTEAVEAINSIVENKDNKWTKDCIFGIEKDYRLARVSKISMFMNGAGDANIIFGDGLENYVDKGIEPETFDILVANPPYSVKEFKPHLKLKDNKFELLGLLSDKSGKIETLFVERIAQLLKPNSVAAVILPSTILAKTEEGYIGAREMLLKNFFIRAIVELEGKTFGATNTSTVILFLEKHNEPPREANIVKDCIDSIMADDLSEDFIDKDIYEAYIGHQNIRESDYKKFLKKEFKVDELKEHQYFKVYVDKFSKEEKKKGFYPKKCTNEEKENIRKDKFYNRFLGVEREKLYYFSLVYEQRTLIISAPTDNDEQVEFLGYSWSNREGYEGIQLLDEGGKLFDMAVRYKEDTLASAIRNSFLEEESDLPEDLQKYIKLKQLKDMITFSTANFDKEIKTMAKLVVHSNYKVVNLIDYAKKIEKGQSITKANTIEGDYKVVAGGKDYAYTHNVFNREPNVITVSASGTAGYVNLWKEKIFASDCITIYGNNDMQTSYIYHYLKSIQEYIYTLKTGSNQPHIYVKDLEDIQIPNPTQEVLERVVNICDNIDEEERELMELISDNKHKIQDIFTKLETITSNKGVRISDICNIRGGKRVPKGTRLLRHKTDHPYLRVTDFKYNSINKKNLRYIDDEIFDKIRRYTISKEDVYISIAGTIGSVGIVPPELDGANLTENAAKLVINNREEISSKFLVCALQSKSVLEQIYAATQALGVPKLALERIGEITIPLPLRGIQDQVVSRVEIFEKIIFDSMEKIENFEDSKKEILVRELGLTSNL